MFELKYKVWIENGGKAFGKGPYDLLKGVHERKSLSEAAKSMGMSYTKAFNLIKDIEERLGIELISRKTGGPGGGGSQLTEEALDLMEKYRSFAEDCDKSLNEIFTKYFGKPKSEQ